MNHRDRGRRRRPVLLPEITLTPLIDVALTLLVIFMVTAPMMHSVIKVDVPKAKAQAPQEFGEDSIVLNVGPRVVAGGAAIEYSIGGRTIKRQDLNQEIHRALARYPHNHTVYICADKSLRFDDVVGTFDLVSAEKGVDHVALVTQKTC